MLTEERLSLIMNMLEQKGSITVTEIREKFNISESTARRDLNSLDQAGKACKVFGGAVLPDTGYVSIEPTVEEKQYINVEEKRSIAKYAASLIEHDDFVYLDAGTTTEFIIDYVTDKSVMFVTNAVQHAQKLAAAGFQVMVVGGVLKSNTKAVVGAFAVECISSMHFSKGFFGTNGITIDAGFTTPDSSEALVKKAAFERCRDAFMLADHDKFGKLSRITFASPEKCVIITNREPGDEYREAAKGIISVG